MRPLAARLTPSALLLVALATSVVLAAPPTGAELKKVLKSGDAAAVKGALEGGALDVDGVKAVLDVVEDGKGGARLRQLGVYEALVAGLGSARGPALEELTKAYKKAKRGDVRFLIVEALGKVPEAPAEATLVEALEDDDESVSVLAARQMGKKATASAVEALIPLLKKFEGDKARSRMVREVNGALAALTGKDDLNVADDWKSWWDSHKNEFRAAAPAAGDATQDRNALDVLKRERPADARTVTRLRPDDVVVIKGSSDRLEDVLEAIGVPHVAHDRADFDKLKLDPTRQVLVLNCAGKTDLTDAGIATVKEFVTQGGYLFTSDWELKNTLEKAFPEVVKFKGESPRDPKEGIEISIRPNRDNAMHPYLRDVFPLGTWENTSFKWKLDSRSHFAADNPNIVSLVEGDMTGHDKVPSNVVCFTFAYPPGSGRQASGGGDKKKRSGGQVLQVSSHFKNQRDKGGDGFALQKLLLNFIVERQESR